MHILPQDGLNAAPWHISPTSWRQKIRAGRALAAMRIYIGMFTTPDDAVEFDLFGRPENDWDLLGIGQHYGKPAPLVDFTFSPMIALAFAIGISQRCAVSKKAPVENLPK